MSDDLVKRLRAAAKHPMMDNNCKADVFDVADAADRIEELEAQLKTVLDRETSILRYYDAKLDAADAKLAQVKDALSAFRDFEDSVFYGIYHEKNKRAAYRGVKRKLLAALKILEVE